MTGRRIAAGALFLCLAGAGGLAEADQFTISGTVTDAEGAPVAGATVRTLDWPGWEVRTLRWIQATTHAEGRFALSYEWHWEPPSHRVMASKEGYALGWQDVPHGEEGHIVLGGEPATCTGTVVNPEGQPLAGIVVWVSWLDLGMVGGGGNTSLREFKSPLHAETDAAGRFEIRGLPPEAEVGLLARGEGWAYYRGGSGSRWPAGFGDIKIELSPEATIAGQVTREGEPAEGVYVFAQGRGGEYGGEGEATTGEDGSYTIGNLPAATYTVMVDGGEEYTVVAQEAVEVAAGDDVAGIDFELIEGALVEGTVTLADTGQPGVGAGIYARGPARPKSAQERHWAGTDEQGHYRLRLAPGDNEVRYTPSMRLPGYPAGRAQPERYEVTLENGERRTGLDFLLRPAQKVAGVVLGPDGEPAPGVEVWLCGAAGPQRERETDEDGRFSLSLGNGSRRAPWLVLARDAERDLAGAAVVHSPDEEGVIRLEQGAYLVASVRDPESKPLEGVEAKVAVDPDERGYWVLPLPFASEADGRLRMGPLPPGQPLRVTVDWEVEQKAVSDRWWRLDRITLAAGEERELPALVLNLAGRSLRGTVVDERQQPVEGAIVCTAAFRPRTMTGAEGRFELSGLKARGTVVVLALAPESGRACALECDPDLVPEANLVLERAPVLQGVVYDPEGRPKPGVEVRLYPRGVDSHFEVLQGFVIGRDTESDERGRYRFEKVVPGFRYQVFVHDEEGHIRGNTAELVAEGGEEPMVMDIYME